MNDSLYISDLFLDNGIWNICGGDSDLIAGCRNLGCGV